MFTYKNLSCNCKARTLVIGFVAKRMDAIFDPRGVVVSNECPVTGSISRGRVKMNTGNAGGFYIADTSSLLECRKVAADMLLYWDYIRAYRDYDDGNTKSPEEIFTVSEFDAFTRLNLGDPGGAMEKVYVSWNLDASGGAGGKSCLVQYGCDSVEPLRTDEVSMVVSMSPEVQEAGYQGDCTIPLRDVTCSVNRVKGSAPNECTGLTATGFLGEKCDEWFDSLPESQGTPNRTTVVENLCGQFPWLDECMCQSRYSNGDYIKYKTEVFNGISDVCWYQPCKMPGNDRLLTPSEKFGRDNCQVDICGTFVNVVNSDEINIDAIASVVACSKEELEEAGMSFDEVGGSLDEILRGIDETTSGNLFLYLGITVLVVAAVAVAVWLARKRALKRKK